MSPGSRRSLLNQHVFSAVKNFEREIQDLLLRQLEGKNSFDDSAPPLDADKTVMRGLHRLTDLRFENALRNAPYLPGSLLYESEDVSQFTGAANGSSKTGKAQSSASFKKIWSGEDVLVTHGSHAQILRGRRVTLSLSIEDNLASKILKTDQPGTQALLSRCLVTWPESLVGKRKSSEVNNDGIGGLQAFHDRIYCLLRENLETSRENFNECEPRVLSLDETAKIVLSMTFDHFESNSSPGQPFANISGFTANASELICRIAAIYSLYQDSNAPYVDSQNVSDASELFNYYASQLARIQESVIVNEKFADAQRLLRWLQERFAKVHKETGVEFILLRYILQHAHPTLRSLERCERALDILEKHRWIYRIEGRKKICLRVMPSRSGNASQ